jgi:hypothetical protein
MSASSRYQHSEGMRLVLELAKRFSEYVDQLGDATPPDGAARAIWEKFFAE